MAFQTTNPRKYSALLGIYTNPKVDPAKQNEVFLVLVTQVKQVCRLYGYPVYKISSVEVVSTRTGRRKSKLSNAFSTVTI